MLCFSFCDTAADRSKITENVRCTAGITKAGHRIHKKKVSLMGEPGAGNFPRTAC